MTTGPEAFMSATKSSLTPVIINASNVAALIGKHPFTKRMDAFLSCWKSTDRASYLAAHKRNDRLTIEQERRRIREASKFLRDDPSTETLLKSIHAPSAAHTFSSMAADVETSKIAEEARRLAYTRHGEEKEMAIIDRVRQVMPEHDFVTCDRMLRKEIGATQHGRPIVLQGRVDGVSSDGRVVLECKTRVHKLFLTMREYERLQVESYLLLMPSAESAVLVEAVFNVGPVPSINLISVDRPSTEIEWLPLALAMGDVVDRVLTDPGLQDSIVAASSRSHDQVLRALVREALARRVDSVTDDAGPC